MDMLSTLAVQLDELEKNDRAAEPGLRNAMCAGGGPINVDDAPATAC